MNNREADLELAKAIVSLHFADELTENGSVRFLDDARVEGEMVMVRLPRWVVLAQRDLYERFGEERGFEYFKAAAWELWKNVGAVKE